MLTKAGLEASTSLCDVFPPLGEEPPYMDHMAPQQLFEDQAVSSLTRKPDVVLIYYQSEVFSFPYSFFLAGLSLTEHLICLVAVIMLWSHLAMGTIWKA